MNSDDEDKLINKLSLQVSLISLLLAVFVFTFTSFHSTKSEPEVSESCKKVPFQLPCNLRHP